MLPAKQIALAREADERLREITGTFGTSEFYTTCEVGDDVSRMDHFSI